MSRLKTTIDGRSEENVQVKNNYRREVRNTWIGGRRIK
jgi:hypothetical protein